MPSSNIRKKQIIVSYICYIANLVLLFFPWIGMGDSNYNIFGLALKINNPGVQELAIRAGVYIDENDWPTVNVGIRLELILFGLFTLFCVLHMIMVLCRKNWQLNVVTFALSIVIYYLHVAGYTIMNVCTNFPMGTIFPGLYLLLSATEFVVVKMMGVWEEAKKESKKFYEKEQRAKEEKKQRLAFHGKYNEFFYRYIWKNFKSNWRDYILLLLCSIQVFTFIIIGFGLHKILGLNSKYEGVSQIFGGLNAILVNALIPVGIISVIIIVVLIFNYLRCHTKNYGIFLTLGMRKRTLQYFVAIEFLALLVITFVVGGAIGTGGLILFCSRSKQLLGVEISRSVIGAGIFAKSVGALLLIFLISFMAARDIFVDFNIGKSVDLRAIREKISIRWRKPFFVLGIIACAYSLYEYRQLRNFENVNLLLTFFVGLFLVLRYGLAEWLGKERKRKNYLKNLMVHNQLFHKIKTNTSYIFAMSVILFCALFYFSFQMISVWIAEDEDALYPYDIVCVADDKDDDIFKGLEEKYKIGISVYPMVRVTNYDSTEVVEVRGLQGEPPQGQQIGISESTYHILKKQIDSSYKESPLKLDDEGEKIHIVHQQDKSVKAQPLDFYVSRKEPLLHIGQPCEYADGYYSNSRDTGFYYKKIEGEEIGSLIGVFRQGLRDNLVVFSDIYFEKARELWKTTDIQTGKPIPEEVEKEEGVNIKQGPTKLVLMNADPDDISSIVSDLSEFKSGHKEDEKYDTTVPCYYTKQEAVQNLRTERVMKITMNLLLMIVFFGIYLILLSVKMATESDMVTRRSEFLMCMGMRKNVRKALLRKELFRYYYILPTITGSFCAALYTTAVFCARQYTKEDILKYLRIMVPLWVTCLSAVGVIVFCMVTVYVRKSEVKNGR